MIQPQTPLPAASSYRAQGATLLAWIAALRSHPDRYRSPKERLRVLNSGVGERENGRATDAHRFPIRGDTGRTSGLARFTFNASQLSDSESVYNELCEEPLLP